MNSREAWTRVSSRSSTSETAGELRVFFGRAHGIDSTGIVESFLMNSKGSKSSPKSSSKSESDSEAAWSASAPGLLCSALAAASAFAAASASAASSASLALAPFPFSLSSLSGLSFLNRLSTGWNTGEKMLRARADIDWRDDAATSGFSSESSDARDRTAASSELIAAGFAFLLALVSGEEVMKESDEPVRFPLAGGEASGLAAPPDMLEWPR
mmetsp:Transcript_53095/g.121105  ORF Transcript_53095/g.121105 Transcript_53095/m.121105 type:complete len:213 (-) Transcript_53095:7-645(-)